MQKSLLKSARLKQMLVQPILLLSSMTEALSQSGRRDTLQIIVGGAAALQVSRTDSNYAEE